MTHKEIAAQQGVHYSRIQQIERRALRKLRRAIEADAAANGVSVLEWLSEVVVPSGARANVEQRGEFVA